MWYYRSASAFYVPPHLNSFRWTACSHLWSIQQLTCARDREASTNTSCTTAGGPRVAASVPQAAAKVYHGNLSAGDADRFAVVVGKFNSLVTNPLFEGAMSAFAAAGVAREDITVAYVPGSFELPVVAKSMAKTDQFAAVVCIGAVVRGSTTHYEEVCSAATSGCLDASSSTGAL